MNVSAPLFEIVDLVAGVTEEGNEVPVANILNGISLTIQPGEVHAIMGPNGSGKSTLANTLMGSPEYSTISGSIRLSGDDITAWPIDVRAKAGVFLAFQYPQEIPGVSVTQFLRQAVNARKGTDVGVLELRITMMQWMQHHRRWHPIAQTIR